MIEGLNTAIQEYLEKWQVLVNDRKEQTFFDSLTPTAVGWKVGTREDYTKAVAELHDDADKIVETWMNGRWIAKLHLKNDTLAGEISVIKIMQRRPGSDDALGLDHLDFYSPDFAQAEQVLKSEPILKWSWETNDVRDGYDWLSIWFDGGEAKLKGDTVLDIVAAELQDITKELIRK